MLKIFKNLILAVTVLRSGSASACSFGPDADIMKPFEENFSNKNVAVLLKIEAINKNADTDFSVVKYYKGSGSKGNFTLINPGHSCALTFAQEYVGNYFLITLDNSSDLQNLSQGIPYKRFETLESADKYAFPLVVKESEKPLPIDRDDIMCPMVYDPVCGQQVINCIQAPCPQPEPKTYSNGCVAGQNGAKILYEGQCAVKAEVPEIVKPVFCTQDAFQCSNGTWVGRSGPNCEFVCGDSEPLKPLIPIEEKAPDEPIFQSAPNDCRSWFDGCNNCIRGNEGGPLACTRKACSVNEKPFCREYFGDEPVEVELPDFGPEPTEGPLVDFIEPTTPPPSDVKEEKKDNIFSKIINWFTGLFR